MRTRDVENPQRQYLHQVFQHKCHRYHELNFSAKAQCVNNVMWAGAEFEDFELFLFNHSALTLLTRSSYITAREWTTLSHIYLEIHIYILYVETNDAFFGKLSFNSLLK